MIEILSPISKGLMQLTGVLSIGLLLTLSFLDSDIKGRITNIKLVKKTKAILLAWLLSTFVFILIFLSRYAKQTFKAPVKARKPPIRKSGSKKFLK